MPIRHAAGQFAPQFVSVVAVIQVAFAFTGRLVVWLLGDVSVGHLTWRLAVVIFILVLVVAVDVFASCWCM